MARRMMRKHHVRCRAGEKVEITSKPYLSLSLLKDAGFLFTDNGYKVKSFNTINLDESMHYNPLKYVKTDTDILSFVNCYIMNTNGDGKAGGPLLGELREDAVHLPHRAAARLVPAGGLQPVEPADAALHGRGPRERRELQVASRLALPPNRGGQALHPERGRRSRAVDGHIRSLPQLRYGCGR